MPTSSNVILLPVTASDFPTLARLEFQVFNNDNWSIVANGPERNSEAALDWTVKALSLQPGNPEARKKSLKAVIGDEIVGFAGWSFNPSQHKTADNKDNDGEEKRKEGESEGEKIPPWPPGANVRFCEDAYIVGDEHMMKSVEGTPYSKLSIIAVSPTYQRQGIGSKLMEAFLKEVDDAGVPAVLGASPEGEGLYRRYGFEEVVVMNFDLRDYGGTPEMGVEQHVIMKRPAKVKAL